MVPPAATGLGAPLLLTARSQAAVTGVLVLVVMVRALVAETEDVAAIAAAVTVGGTFTTTMIDAEVVAAKVGSVQVIFPVAPTAGVVHVQPAGADTEAKVVLAGTASRKLTLVAAAGPLFVIAWTYVISLPAKTESGVAAVVRPRSACEVVAVTVSFAIAELGPEVWLAALTVAVLVMSVPIGAVAFTLYTAVNVPVAPGATLGLVQLTGGAVQVQPGAAAAETETNVTSATGEVDSVNVAAVAAREPTFVTTCV